MVSAEKAYSLFSAIQSMECCHHSSETALAFGHKCLTSKKLHEFPFPYEQLSYQCQFRGGRQDGDGNKVVEFMPYVIKQPKVIIFALKKHKLDSKTNVQEQILMTQLELFWVGEENPRNKKRQGSGHLYNTQH